MSVTLSYRTITSFTITNGGGGYATPPTITVATAIGSGCTATGVITGGVLTAINVTNGGAYTGTPTVNISSGTGVGAAATPVMSTVTVGTRTSIGQVALVNVTGFGTGYTSPPSVALPGGGGSGATAVALMTVEAFAVTNGGGGFITLPTVTVGGDGTGSLGTPHLAPTTVDRVIMTASGSGYSALPTVTLTTPSGQAGSGATASPRMQVSAFASVGAGGTGYAVGDLLTVAGGTATTTAIVRVTAVGSTGNVAFAAVDTPGDYSALPVGPAATTGGGGSGATVNLRWSVKSIVVTNAGTGYSAQPSVTVAAPGGGGATATATATLVATSLASISGGGGHNYSGLPPVTVSGGAGSGATAVVTTMRVDSVKVTAGGSGYTSNPAVTFSGGGGSGAVANATVRRQACFGLSAAGGYNFSGSIPDYITGSGSIVLATCADSTANLNLTPTKASFTLSAVGCLGGALSGVTFTITGGGSAPTTDASGITTSTLLASGVAYTITASHPRYSDTHSQTVTLAACGTSVGFSFTTPLSQYVCLTRMSCGWPLAKSLTLSDPQFGATALTYDASSGSWLGSTTGGTPGCAGGCAGAAGVVVHYRFVENAVLIAYSEAPDGCPGPNFIDAGDASTTVGSGVGNCPPSFVFTFTSGGNIRGLYCSDMPITVME